jgi:hypothetical protein
MEGEIDKWENMYQHLVIYKKEFGDCLAPRSFKSHGYSLGSWVSKQRSKKERLTSGQLDLLNELGFV